MSYHARMRSGLTVVRVRTCAGLEDRRGAVVVGKRYHITSLAYGARRYDEQYTAKLLAASRRPRAALADGGAHMQSLRAFEVRPSAERLTHCGSDGTDA